MYVALFPKRRSCRYEIKLESRNNVKLKYEDGDNSIAEYLGFRVVRAIKPCQCNMIFSSVRDKSTACVI